MTKRTFVPRASTAVVTYEGAESLCTSGKDNTLIVAADGRVSIAGPREGKYRAPEGIRVDPSEWCEPSHDTCDLNTDVEIPRVELVSWHVGNHPMQTQERSRPPRYCVPCFERAMENGWSLADWSAVVELRAEAMRAKEAA